MKNLSTVPRAKRMFAVAFILVMGFSFSESASQCVTPPSGLISWWPGDGNANDIEDGNNGSLVNGATFATGKVGQAFILDGTNDYVEIPDNPNLTPSSITLDAWVKPDVISGNPPIVSKYNSNNPSVNGVSWVLLMFASGQVRFVVFQDAAGNIARGIDTDNAVLSAGIWQHVAATFDLATQEIKIYVNGVDVPSTLIPGASSTITSIADSNTPVRIGTFVNSLGNFDAFWDGLIDEVDIYNRAFTAQEIQSIYNAGSAGKCTTPPVCFNPPSGLVSWWPGEDNANDIQSGNHGTLQNGATFAAGKVGQAFSFDGVDDFVEIPENGSLDLNGNFTVEAWVKPESYLAVPSPVITKYNYSGGNLANVSWQLDMLNGGNVQFGVACGTNSSTDLMYQQTTNAVVSLNVFTHLAAVYQQNPPTIEIYVNGVLQASTTNGSCNFINQNDTPVRIGKRIDSGSTAFFDGIIDEVSIYNRALSASEIQSIYNAGSASKCKECMPPEVSINGNDPVFTGTIQTYTAITGANNPSFEWSVTGGTINGSNTNGLVSVTAGAAGTMMVSVNVTDGVTNCSKEETKNVTVNPLPAGSNEVVFATNSVWLKEHAKVLSGNVVVNNASSGPVLDSQVELSVGQSVTTPAGVALKANRIKVKQGAVVASDVFYNELTSNGTSNGSQNTPLALPVFASLPAFHQASAGTQDITVNQNRSITLTAGAYRDILVKQNGTIIFSGGGTFAMRSLNTGAKAKLLFDAPTEILIAGKLDTDENSYVGPQSGSGIGAADIVFYIAGSNGNNGNFGATPKAAQLGLKNTVLANFYVPNGTLWLRQGTVATGAFLGRDVIVGEQVQVTLESAFDGGSSLAKSADNEGREEKLISNHCCPINLKIA